MSSWPFAARPAGAPAPPAPGRCGQGESAQPPRVVGRTPRPGPDLGQRPARPPRRRRAARSSASSASMTAAPRDHRPRAGPRPLDQSAEQQRVDLVVARRRAGSRCRAAPRTSAPHCDRTRETSTCSALVGLAGRSSPQTTSISAGRRPRRATARARRAGPRAVPRERGAVPAHVVEQTEGRGHRIRLGPVTPAPVGAPRRTPRAGCRRSPACRPASWSPRRARAAPARRGRRRRPRAGGWRTSAAACAARPRR